MNWHTHHATCHVVSTTAVFELQHRLPIWAPPTLYTDLVRKHLHAESQNAPQIGPSDSRPIRESHPQNGQFEFFGGYPAIDVLRLATNEGMERQDPLDILFVGKYLIASSFLFFFWDTLLRLIVLGRT